MPAWHPRRLVAFQLARLPACILLAVVALATTGPAQAAPPPTWALAPTRIRVYLSAEATPEWTAPRRGELSRELTARTQSLAGALWRLDVLESPRELASAARAGLDRVQNAPAASRMIESLALAPEGPQKESFDKVVLVHLSASPEGEIVQAREWDGYTASWGPVITRPAPAGGLLHAAFTALHAACGTVGRIDLPSAITVPGAAKGEAKTDLPPGRVYLRVRGGDLAPRDSSMAPAQVGDVLRVVRRTPGSAQRLPVSQDLPYTYVTIEKITGAQAICRVHSHFRDPLAQPLAARDEWIALGVAPTGAGTALKVVKAGSPGGPAAPIAGLEVLAYAPTGGRSVALGRTGRDGSIAIPAAESALRVLVLKRGPDLVARFPVTPGWPTTLEIPLAGDEVRMAVAASAAAIEVRVLELVTRREIELARLRARVQEKRKSEAEQLLTELAAFDAQRAELDRWIQEEKTRHTTADAETQQHVNQVFADLSATLAKHLDQTAVQQLATELSQAQATPADQPPAGAADKPAGPTSQDPAAAAAVAAAGAEIRVERSDGTRWNDALFLSADTDDAKFAMLAPHLKNLKNVQSVNFSGSKITDASLVVLKEIPGLRIVELQELTNVTDAGMAHVAAIPALEGADFFGCRITDAGLPALRSAVKLRLLRVGKTAVTGAGMASLASLTELRVLSISDTAIDDGGLRAIAVLSNLEKLDLANTRVTDAGLQSCAALTKLDGLALSGLPISDAGLAALKPLGELTNLYLKATKITDASAPVLKGFAKLQVLEIRETGVTPAAAADLQKALPSCRITGPQP